MKLFDVHSHWKTRRGYALRSEEELALQRYSFGSTATYATEEEMADDFRKAEAKVILDFGFTKFLPIEEAQELHDYGFAVQRAHSDVIYGNWLHFQPEDTMALPEFRRCLDNGSGFIGLAASGSGGRPASDPAYDPFYKLCIEARIPALILVGTTALGAGRRGGGGVILDHCHPRHVDCVAARYPELTIIAGRPAWPWQAEMIAVLLHKDNVWCELHGWSPRYLTADLKHELPRRLRSKVMFGADYPMLTYDRLLQDWRDLDLPEDVLVDIFYRNAESLFAEFER